MRKLVTFTAADRRVRTPYTDFIRPADSNTVSSPGSVTVIPGSGGMPDECAAGLPTPLCPPTVVSSDYAYAGEGTGAGLLDEDGYLVSSFVWDAVLGPYQGQYTPNHPLAAYWPGGLRAPVGCWADTHRAMGASAGHSSDVGRWVRPGASWRISATISLAEETGDAPWENVENYSYQAWLRFYGTGKPTLSYEIIHARYHNVGCIDQDPTVSALFAAGYSGANISFRYRLGGWRYRAQITATPPGYVVLPVSCPDPGPQPPGTYSESLIYSGGGIFTSRATNLSRFIEVYFDGVLAIEGIDYVAYTNLILPLYEPYPNVIDVVYVV